MDPRRALPSVDRVGRRALRTAAPAAGRRRPCVARRGARRRSPAALRSPVRRRRALMPPARVERRRRAFLRPVLNATGVLLHTNLGRAPLGDRGSRRGGGGRARLLEPRVRPRRRGAGFRATRTPAPLLARGVRRRSRARREQQRGRGAPHARRAGPGSRRRRVARRAGRDRRRVPGPGDHGGVGVPARRGRHDQPHADRRLRGGARRRRGAGAQGPRVELPHGRLHRGHHRRRARRASGPR